jgi:hypothetical protein
MSVRFASVDSRDRLARELFSCLELLDLLDGPVDRIVDASFDATGTQISLRVESLLPLDEPGLRHTALGLRLDDRLDDFLAVAVSRGVEGGVSLVVDCRRGDVVSREKLLELPDHRSNPLSVSMIARTGCHEIPGFDGPYLVRGVISCIDRNRFGLVVSSNASVNGSRTSRSIKIPLDDRRRNVNDVVDMSINMLHLVGSEDLAESAVESLAGLIALVVDLVDAHIIRVTDLLALGGVEAGLGENVVYSSADLLRRNRRALGDVTLMGRVGGNVAEAMPASQAARAAAKRMFAEMSWRDISDAIRCGGASHMLRRYGESML